MADYNTALANRVHDLVTGMVDEGKSPGEIAKALRSNVPGFLNGEPISIQRPGKSKFTATPAQYAEMLARTMPNDIRNEGYIEKMKEMGVADGWIWDGVLDGSTCEKCKKEIRDKRVRSWDEPRPPQASHPSCLHPDTFCIAIGGALAATRSWYDGPMIQIKFSSGRNLTITPNHMLLTPIGFAAAKFLLKGDYVLGCSELKGPTSCNPDDNDSTSTIEEIFDSLRLSGSMATRRMPVTAIDFHGDARFIKKDIDIVWADSFLGGTLDTPCFDHISENHLSSACPSAIEFPGLSDLTSDFTRLAATSDSIMGGVRQSHPFFRRRLTILRYMDSLRFRGVIPLLSRRRTITSLEHSNRLARALTDTPEL
jgi:hypothetical protein